MLTATTPARPAGLRAAILIAALVAAPARGETALRWKFTKGQTIAYTSTQRTKSREEAGGRSIESTMTQLREMSWEVKDVDASGRATLGYTFRRIRYIVEGAPLGKFEYDSAEPKEPEGPLAEIVSMQRAMVGAPFELKMSPRGEISDVKVPPKVAEALKGAGPGGEEGFKEMIAHDTLILPEAEVAPGKTWTEAKKSEAPFGTQVQDLTYTVRPGPGPEVTVDIAVRTAIEPKPGSPIEMKLASEDSKGRFTFDAKAGALKSSELVQKMKFNVNAGGQAGVLELDSTSTVAQGKSPSK